MSDDQFEGTARNVGGKIQDAVGGLTGDTKTQAEGKLNQAAGTAQQVLGDAKQSAAAAAEDAKAKVSGIADRVATTASDLGHNAYEKSVNVAQSAGEQLRENPLTMMVVAGVLGLVVGYFIGRPPYERAIQVGRARIAYRDR